MSEAAGIPTVEEHVSMGENGVIMLSEEAQRVMESIEAPQLDEPTEEQPVDQPVVETGRKIKWNGQEVEVKPEQEVELLQKGYNYEQKMAQLEAERARIQAYNGLVSAIEASPEIKSKVAQALGYQQAQSNVSEQPPEFDDPIEQLKWETRQEVLKEVEEKYAKPFQQQMKMQTHQQVLNSVRQQVQADPMFNDVQAEMIKQIQAMPASIGKNLYLQLDQDPKAYMEMFQTVKARLGNSQPQPTQQAEVPQPSKRETKAPLLESTDSPAQETAAQQQMQERIKELTKRSKAGDFKATGELMQMLA